MLSYPLIIQLMGSIDILFISLSCDYHYNHVCSFNPLNAEAIFVQSARMQRLLKKSKPCHVGIHWMVLAEYSQMYTHVPGFQSFFRAFALFCIEQISHQQHKG